MCAADKHSYMVSPARLHDKPRHHEPDLFFRRSIKSGPKCALVKWEVIVVFHFSKA